jgi:hypothetical protein
VIFYEGKRLYARFCASQSRSGYGGFGHFCFGGGSDSKHFRPVFLVVHKRAENEVGCAANEVGYAKICDIFQL